MGFVATCYTGQRSHSHSPCSFLALYTPERFEIRQESHGKTIGQGTSLYRQSDCSSRAGNSKTVANRKLGLRSEPVQRE
jgi:hypothetical protein